MYHTNIPQCTILQQNVHISVTKCCIVGHWTGVLWDLCDKFIAIFRIITVCRGELFATLYPFTWVYQFSNLAKIKHETYHTQTSVLHAEHHFQCTHGRVCISNSKRLFGRHQGIAWTYAELLSLRDKFQCNLNQNSNISIQENAFENVVSEMAAILSSGNELKTSSLRWDIRRDVCCLAKG